MRLSNRNKQVFWYALFDDTHEEYDEYGNQIGMHSEYGKPVKASGNISAAKGEVIARQFGEDEAYDRVIVVEDRDTPIDEYAVLWVDVNPELDEDDSLKRDEYGEMVTPWNYIVKGVGRGLPMFGSASIAISKVDVS